MRAAPMEGFYLDEYIRNRGRAGESGEMGAGGGVGKSEVSGVASDFKNEILGAYALRFTTNLQRSGKAAMKSRKSFWNFKKRR